MSERSIRTVAVQFTDQTISRLCHGVGRPNVVLARTFDLLPQLFAVDPTGASARRVTGPLVGPNSAASVNTGLGDDAATVLGARPGPRGQAGGASDVAEGDGNDPDELHNLVVEHGDAIYRLALSVVRDKSLAEDIAQETLVKAWLALPTFRAESSLRSWVLRIAHNTAISTIRRRRAIVTDPDDFPEEPTLPDRSVESKVQGEIVMSEFVDALDTLDDLSRSIVVLREVEGMAYDEIAEVLGVPMPTVKTRLLRARRKLSSALREWS